MTNVTCTQCNAILTPEDAVYDEQTQQYFCSMNCFRDWADDNFELITDFYERMNVT